jgi:predicted regulator of Ras-like GTPase activity (Roadblock/LC7/MglB family)
MDSLQVESINKELNKFELLGGILGIAIVDRNGLTILSRLPRSIEERKFGAMAATIIGAMETAAAPFKEDLINLTIEFEDSQLIIMSSDANIIFVVFTELEIDLGFILIEIEEIISNIKNILRG